jgi:hypothetical protein
MKLFKLVGFALLVLFWTLLAVGLTLQAWRSAKPEDRAVESIKVGFIVFGGLGVVLPAYFTIWQGFEVSSQNALRLDWDKSVFEFRRNWDLRENAMRLLDDWDEDSLLEARREVRALRDMGNALSGEELIARTHQSPALRQNLIRIFDFWDGVRTSVESGRVAEKLVFDSLHPALFACYETCKPWLIEEGRKNRNFAEDAERLYLRWKSPIFPPT